MNGKNQKGAGRPTKAEEKRVFGTEQKAWDTLADEAKISFPHRKLLMEYAYGKPKELKDIDINAVIRIVDDTEELKDE